jgi:hypothetical protein
MWVGLSGGEAKLLRMTPEATAGALSARIDALAAALRAAGVAPERSALLLARASEAALDAVTLDAMRTPAVEPPAEIRPLRIAA